MKKSNPEPLHTIITRMMMTQQTIFVLLILMVFAVSSHWSAKTAIQQARQSTLLITTNVSDYLSSSEHALVALAVSEPTQSGLDSVRASFNEFDVIYYIQPNGKLERISPKTSLITVGMDMTSQPYFNPGQTGLEISTPFNSSRTGKPTVYISQPVSRGGGLIVGELNLSQLQSRIIDVTTSTTGISYIIDKNGYFIAHPDPDKVASHESIRQTGIYQDALENTNKPLYSWDKNNYSIYTIEAIPHTNWYVINQLPFWTVYGPFLIPTISGLLGALGLLIISTQHQRRILSRRVIEPLELLTDQAHRISSGTYLDPDSRLITPEAYAEVSVLMDSISTMEEAVRTRENDNYRLLFDVQRHLRQERLLRDIDDAIKPMNSLDHTLKTILTRVNSRLSIDASNIYIYQPDIYQLRGACTSGFMANPDQDVIASFTQYITRVSNGTKLLYVHDLEKSKEYAFKTLHRNEKFRSYVGIPLYVRKKHIGFLNLFTRSTYTPANDELSFLKLVGAHTALAIDSTLMLSDLQVSNLELVKAYDSTLEGWSHAMDLRDRETEGHTLRVTELSEKLAKQMGIPDELLVHVRRGSLLHDIGKIAVPDSILLKPGPLNDQEWVIMRRHPQYARDFLIPIDYLRPAVDIPLRHHERWDGNGYPDNLAGENIPLAARIFSVIDVWDALTSDRPYRAAWPRKKALKYVLEQSGIYFDPEVVKQFLKIIS